MTKSAAVTDVNADGKTDLGDKIQWSFLVKNTGTTTLTTVAIADVKAGASTCGATTLAPGASTTCTATATYAISQADVDAGVVNNTATASAKSPSGTTVTSAPSSTSTAVVQTAGLLLTKSAAVTDVNGNGKTDLGDKIQWSFLVKNTGTTTITTAAIADAKAGATTCPVTTLAPGASTTCTATTPHTVVQAEVDAGVVSNTATASGKSPAGAAVTSNASQTDTPINQAPALQLTKSAAVTDVDGDGKTDLGDKIQWSFLVKNTGTVTLTGLVVTDPKVAATSCPATTLVPGASTTCAATTAYPISQADVDAGVVNNTATSSAKNPSGVTVASNSSSTSTVVVQTAALLLTKTAGVTDVNGDGRTDLGDRITWSFAVRNTGTTTVSTVAINDATAGPASCLATTLAPGASTTCTSAAHVITQAEVDSGVVSNTANATGRTPANATVTSNTSQTDTPIAQTGALQLTKSAAVTDVDGDGATDLGDRVTWSFLLRNTGTTSLTTAAVNDPTAGAVTCPPATLAPNATTTCTAAAAHTIVQADVDAGVVSNTATATAKGPSGATVTSNSSHTDTPVTRSSTLKLVKRATVTDVNGDSKIDLGDTVAWTFQLTNAGTTTLTGAAVLDPTAGSVTCPLTTLTPGATTTCTATTPHPITQAEVDAGTVNNTATATAIDSGGATVTSAPSSTTTPVAQSTALQLTKSAAVTDANGNGKTDLGDQIQWSFLLKNTGTTTVTTTGVTDAKAGAVSCPVTTLAPGAQTTCTSTAYTVTQPDVDAGHVDNTATATAKSPAGVTVTSNPSSTTTPVASSSALQLTKSAAVTDVNANGRTDLGDKITWSFLVKNTGTATITGVVVNDPSAASVSCPATPLAPGASTTCTATAHSVTQSDVDTGFVTNTATAAGTSPGGAAITSNPSTTDTPVAQAPALQLTKSAAVTDVDGDGKTDLGDTIAWSFLIRNTGTTTLTSIAVNDPKAPSVNCAGTPLVPGGSTTCTAAAAYPITQADVDAGVVTNTATATARGPGGATVTSNPSSTSTPVASANSLLLTKSAVTTDVDGDFVVDRGDRIQWSFLVKNTGTATVGTLAIADPVAGAVTCPVTTLTPGASTTCTATVAHVITQADVDAGVVNNTATASAKSPGGATVTSNPSSTSTAVVQTTGLSLTKSAAVSDANGNGRNDLGDVVTWSFLVRNTGTVTASSVAVTDARAGTVTCPVTTLAPGASTTCSAGGHAITQADVDAGVVSNTATAAGKAPSGAAITAAPSSTDTPVAQSAALALIKSASLTDVNGDGQIALGDRIAWSFLVKNSGTVTVTGVAVNDATAGAVSCPVTTLAPGASTTCSATAAHTVTQADVDAGDVSNTASATGKDPKNVTVTSNPSSTDTTIPQSVTLTLVKSAAVTDVNGDGRTALGDRIAWSFLVKNSGTTTLTSVAVSDATAGAVSCPSTTLAPGVSMTCTATTSHSVTQADVDAGVVTNTATVSAKDSHGATVTSAPSSTTTPIAQTSSMTLTKSAAVNDLNGDFKIDLGDRITWTLLVKNTGTTTINTLVVNDPVAGAVSCPVGTLAPNATTTCTVPTHLITQADVDAGVVSNTGTASAKTPQGNPITAPPSTTDTPVVQNAGLTLAKSAAPNDVNGDAKTDLGDRIQWSFLVTNNGTTTVTSVAINDPKAGATTCPATTLAPGASTTCTATTSYVITQADVDAGVVSNTATASAKDPSSSTVTSNASSTSTPVVQASGLQLTKSAVVTDLDADGKTDLGDRIVWSFLVKNTGTTTITSVAVNDATSGAVSCPATTLAPNASTTCTSAAHPVTQADVDAGVVSNTATATGVKPGGGTATSNPSSTDTAVAQTAALLLTKSATVTDVNGDAKTDLGDRIAWSFLVKDTGTTTVTSVAVNDPKAGAVSCPATTLAPGASTTCTAAAYTITQPDVDAGHVANTATATAKDSKGNPISSPPSSTDTPVAQSPGLSLVKSAATHDVDGDFKVDLGDTITWSFLVQNTGTTTVGSVAIADATAGPVTCLATTLTPGATTTCTSTAHPITQADVDAGVVSNTATATGTAPGGSPVTSPPSSTDTTIAQAPALSLVKSAAVTDGNADGKTDLGDIISWSFLVKNVGTTTLSAVAVNDPKAGPVSCPASALAPGVSTMCTATPYPIAQADVDAAHVANTATAAARTPGGSTLTSAPSSTDTPVAQSSSLAVTKSAVVTDVNADTRTDLGDTVAWSFLVQNTGSTTVTAVAVSDPTAGAVSCPVTTLAPGGTTTCTAASVHAVTQADVDAGVVSNTATASGRDPRAVTVTSPPSSTDTPVAQAPALSLVKSAAVTDGNHDAKTDLGDTIAWSFLVTNTGTTTITAVAVGDPLAGPISCPATTLAPGASTTCTSAAYSITQPDVDAGHVDNTATASARSPQGTALASNPSSTSTPVTQLPNPFLTKSAAVTDVDGDGRTDLGDVIDWSFLVQNTGNVTLDSIQVTDPTAGVVSCPTTDLTPGQTTTCTAAPHRIGQADVDAGVVDNTAVASGHSSAAGTTISNESSTDTPVTQLTSLSMAKSATVADVDADGRTDLGDTITWSFLVTNTGTTTISSVAIADPKAGPVSCPVTSLAPGGSTTCVASTPYSINQADVDAAHVANTATATAQDPSGGSHASAPSATDTPVVQSAALVLTKSAAVTDVDVDGATDLGDRIVWSFQLRNAGTTTLTGLAVTDPTAGAVSCPVSTLPVGATATCTATTAHVVGQADVDAGVVSNTATALATRPGGGAVPSAPSSTDTAVDQVPGLHLTKSAIASDVDGDGQTDLGDRITWTFLVSNSGTVTVHSVAVVDPVAGAVSCPAPALAPGASATCLAADHTVNQADVDAGVVLNTATADALTSVGATATSNPSSTATPVRQAPAVKVTKSATVTDVDGDGQTDLGDTIGWSFLVANAGTTTLTAVVVTDPVAGAVTCPATTLAPGASTACTASAHAVSQADVDAGVVSNTATAAATAPGGSTVTSPPSSTDTAVHQSSSLALTKSAAVTDVDADGRTDLGDRVTWSFLVTNTGTTTLTTVGVDDPTAGAVSCPATTLARGTSVTCTSTTYVVTQADVDDGVISNTATADAAAPGGSTVISNVSSTDTPVTQAPALSITKAAAVDDMNGDHHTDLGDTIGWTFVLTNTGTTTLHALAVNDPKAGAVSCPATMLAPGAATTCVATVAYPISQSDVDAGDVSNTATAFASDASGVAVLAPPSSTDTAVDQAPALSLTKAATVTDVDTDGRTGLGDTVSWSFLVSNSGTTTVSGLLVNDPTAGPVDCPVTVLAPGAATTCTATTAYAITQADVDAGVVANTASAAGTDPLGDPVVSPDSSTATAVWQGPALTLVKSAAVVDVDSDGRTDLGDTVSWSFLVTDTGNTTVATVGVVDPTAGAVSCPVTSLAPGASATCSSAAHAITQADVDAGTVSNTATARGRTALGAAVVSGPSSTDTPVAQAAALTATKVATVGDVDGDGQTGLGDTITWSVSVVNSGTVSVSALAITDPKSGPMTCAATTLAPGAATVCTADAAYTITQPDVDAGTVDNTATATANDPAGVPVTSPPTSVSTPVAATSSLRLTKRAVPTDVDLDGLIDAGDAIAWSFKVRNTGSTTLHGLAVSDPVAGPVTCPVTTLAPGDLTVCTADRTRTITQADVDTGDVLNTATAAALDPSDVTTTSAPSSTDTPLTQLAALRLVKHGTPTDLNHNGIIDAGDTILWTFSVTNTGSITLQGVTVTDTRAGQVTCGKTTLVPGESTRCTSTKAYVISTADAKAGAVHNVATATGSCGCKAEVKAVKAAAVVATKRAASDPPSSHPAHPGSDPSPIVPGLPYTGAMGITWAIRGGLMALTIGAFLLIVTRRRREDDGDEPVCV